MNFKIVLQLVILPLLLLLGACSSQGPEKEQFSGFLSNYDQLQKREAADGVEILAWVKPGLDLSAYQAVQVVPVVLVASPDIDERLNAAELEKIRKSLADKMRAEISKVLPVTDKAGPGVLVFSLAIAGVDAVDRDLSWYEYMPITYAASRVAAASGARDESIELWIEGKWTDGASGELLSSGVRKGQSHDTVGADEALESVDLDSLLEQWAVSSRQSLDSLRSGD